MELPRRAALRRRSGPLLAAAAILLLALPAVAREDDVDFALRLTDRGYEDLANREVERMLQGNPTPERRENAEYTRCQLLRRAALLAASNPKSEPAEVRAKFGAAGKSFEGFLKAFPNSRLKNEAEFHMANLMKDFAYYLAENKDKFPAADQEGVVKEAHKTFEDAIRYLQAIKAREEAAAEKSATEPDPDDPNAGDDEVKYYQRNLAWYYLCMAMHDRALLLPPGDALRTQQLTQAIDETTKLLESTDGGIFGYLAGMQLGLQYWHRAEGKKGFSPDDIRQAKDWFSGPIDAADTYTNVEQDWPALVDVILQAAFHYGEMCNAVRTLESVNYQKLFFEKVGELEDKIPASVRGKTFGLKTLIEKARSMAGIGMNEAAIAELNRTINLATQADPSWGKSVEQQAKKGLNDVLAAIPSDSPVQLGADVLFKAGEGSLRDRSFGRAIRAFQRVLLTVEAEPDPEKKKQLTAEYYGKCWLRINECYGWMERFLEAFQAADYPVQRYLSSGRTDSDEDIGRLAYYRITALQTLAARAPKEQKPEFQDRLKRAQELFTTKFKPMVEEVGESVTYTVALQKLLQGASLVKSGDAARGKALLKEAIKGFREVSDKDPVYGFAQARIGECFVEAGEPAEALKHLQDLLKRQSEEWGNPNLPPRQKQPAGWAIFWIANAYDDLNQPPKVVETLEGFEKKFEGANLATSFPRVRYLRIGALVKGGRGPEAEKECQQLFADSKDSPYTPMAALVVANELTARANKAHKEGNRKGEQELRKRAADLYDFWVGRSGEASADDLKFVGSLFADIGDAARAAELWDKALAIYVRDRKTKEAETITIYLAGLLVGQGKYAEALPKFEELFVKTPGNVDPLRDVYATLRQRPSNVAQAVHEKMVKDTLAKVAEELAKDPAGTAGIAEAKKAAATGETEGLVRAYADSPDARRALARATALTMLGTDAAMPPERKGAVFGLVKRTPDLMSNLARCYEELATASAENPIRAVNLYSVLIDAAPDPEGEAAQPGQKYSERWFEWKRRWINVYLTTGTAYKSELWLRTVCGLVASMETLKEFARADKERPDFSKEFLSLRDKADSALRSLGKEGCK